MTRWDVATGAECRCYGGEHTENVTGVAWLRDGRGFISAGLDRSAKQGSWEAAAKQQWERPELLLLLVVVVSGCAGSAGGGVLVYVVSFLHFLVM